MISTTVLLLAASLAHASTCPTIDTRGKRPSARVLSWKRCQPERPEAQLHDLARPRLLDPGQRLQLLEVLSESCRQGLELQVVTASATPTFSIVDLAEKLWRCGGEQVDRAVLVATRIGGVHARIPWSSHRSVRRLARHLDRELTRDRGAAMLQLAQQILEGHRDRLLKRRILLLLAAAALIGMVLVILRALRGRGPRAGADGSVARDACDNADGVQEAEQA